MSDYTREDFEQDTEFAKRQWEARTGEFGSFDRWYAETVRAAKEQAWDEGHEAAWSYWVPGGIEPAVNPYAKEEP